MLKTLFLLEAYAEGRRIEKIKLIEAIDRLISHVVQKLREGDYVTVAGRTYVVEMWRPNYRAQFTKLLTVDKGALGMRRHQNIQYASDENNITFANNAADIVKAFTELARTERDRIASAAAKAIEVLDEVAKLEEKTS